jgi:predicted DNA-binding transcriptional regulator
MWWDMFLKNMKISEIARKYNISERWANDLKQKFMKEIGNDGTIREIVPNSRKAQRKNGDDKR